MIIKMYFLWLYVVKAVKKSVRMKDNVSMMLDANRLKNDVLTYHFYCLV